MHCDPTPLSFVEWNPLECAWLKASVLPIMKCQFLLNQTVLQARTLDQQTNKQIQIFFPPHCDLAPLSFVTFMLNGIRLSVCG